jgi:hypothetical protein
LKSRQNGIENAGNAKVKENDILRLILGWKQLPKHVRVVQVNNDKVWLVDEPRTVKFSRYLKIEEIDSIYKKVI